MEEILLDPIERKEFFLAKLGGQEVTPPDPVTRIERYLQDIIDGNASTLPPVTRVEFYLANISGADVPIPVPVTRIELYLAKIAGMEVETPEPVTRLEYWLKLWAEAGPSAVVETVTGTLPLTLANAISHAILSLTRYGLCTQSGTPTPSAPADIVCNNGALKWNGTAVVADGTPEVLTVGGKNLYDRATNPIEQGNISSTTGQNTGASSRVRTRDYIPVKPNTTYTISATIEGYTPGVSKGVFLYQYNADASEWDSSGWKDANGYTFTTGATTAKIRAVFAKAGSGATTPDMVSNAQIEEGSTATAYEPYIAPQTASVVDLLGVGDYKDTHDIISGSIERNVGVILYDGSEDENWSRLGTNAFAVTNSVKKFGKYTMLCSHYTYTDATSAKCSSGEFGCSSGTPRTIYFKNELYDTVEDWKAAIAADPIIVVYPLATETTEQTTAQHLSTHQGTNIVDSTANVSPLVAKVEYMERGA